MRTLVYIVIDSLTFGGLYSLFALGIALIFGVMDLINFAHGELIMVGAYTLFFLGGEPWPVMLAGCLAAVVIFALVVERVAFRPVRGHDPSTLLVTSFAVSYLVQNLAILLFGSNTRSITLSQTLILPIAVHGYAVPRISLVIIATTVVLLIAVGTFLRRTPYGIQMRAAAEDFPTARLHGVRANSVIALAFALSGFLAAVASILLVAQTGTITPTMGVTPVLVAFVATIVGGLGRLDGAVWGGMTLGALTVVLQTELPFSLRPYRDAFVFGAVIVILVFRPNGLLGARGRPARV